MPSLAEELAALPPSDRISLVETFSDAEADALLRDWHVWARPEQLAPPGQWRIWLILAGRGWGKTKTGAEDVAAYGMAHPDSRIAIVAPTYADARDTCVEGESGLLSALPAEAMAVWNRSLGELLLNNGTRYKLFSGDQPDRLRGPQHHRAWCDELAAWPYEETFHMLMLGLRLGTEPRCIVTTTPRPTKLIKELISRVGVDVVKSGGSTYENAANLAPGFLQTVTQRYHQTRMGRQELFAEILEDNPGALWTRALIEDSRVSAGPEMVRVVVGVDPAVTAEEDSAETGIVTCGLGADEQYYVLDDRSLRATPHVWASHAVAAYRAHRADRIIGEVNNGGLMVEEVLRHVDPEVSYKEVRATRGKQLRAEPIAALYEQGRVHHVGAFPALEDQCCEWVPGETSPDRLDALVWALTELSQGGGFVPWAGEGEARDM